MIKRMVKGLLIAIGLGALVLFIWTNWGSNGRISDFFLMLWDWYYAITSGLVSAVNTATGKG